MKSWKDIERGETESQKQDLDKETPEKVKIKKDPNALVSVSELLPGVCISSNALVAFKEKQELYGHVTYSYSQAQDRLRELKAAAVQNVDELSSSSAEQAQNTTLTILARKKGEISLMHNQDALEEVRVQLGLDKLRDKLLADIRKKLSFERGLKQLSKWTQENLGRSCDSIREANELFPHLTLSELAFFAFLEELPRWMLFYGTNFDASHLAKNAGLDDFESGARRRVPQQLWGTVHGLFYVLDDYEPEVEDTGKDLDPYAVLGFTGIRESTCFAEYNESVKHVVRNLVPLLLSNARLYEKVWQNSPESLQVGFGRIARLALERVMGEEGRQAASVDVSVAIEMLNAEHRKSFEEEKRCLEQTVVQSSIYDLARDMALRSDETVRLIGILDSVPNCMAKEQSFTGFVQPFGASVRFISPDGKIVEQCFFSPMHRREAVGTITEEMDDVGRENRTIAHLFRELFASVQGAIMDKFSNDENSLSLLEALVLKVWEEQRVVLQPLPMWSLVPVRNFTRDIMHYVITGKDIVARVTSKIGLLEARQIQLTLQLAVPALLAQVKRIVKTPAIHSIHNLMAGMAIDGCYEQNSQTITLMEFREKLYGNIPAIEKAARSFVLLHECGEAFWTTLDEKTRERWKKISWAQKRRRVEKHFLTFYAHHSDEKEDFCDHFAAYLLHGPEFRMAAADAGSLKRKYRLIRRIIAAKTGSQLEYPRFLPWTIREIHGALQQEVERMKLEDAVLFEEEHFQERYKSNAERIFEIRKTFETLVSDAERSLDAQDIEDPVERQIEENDDDEEEDFEDAIEVEDGFIEMHEIRASVGEALESVMDAEDFAFSDLRDKLTEFLLDGDWTGVGYALEFLSEEDAEDLRDLLKDIEVGPQKPL